MARSALAHLFSRILDPLVLPQQVNPTETLAQLDIASDGRLAGFSHDGSIEITHSAADANARAAWASHFSTALDRLGTILDIDNPCDEAWLTIPAPAPGKYDIPLASVSTLRSARSDDGDLLVPRLQPPVHRIKGRRRNAPPAFDVRPASGSFADDDVRIIRFHLLPENWLRALYGVKR